MCISCCFTCTSKTRLLTEALYVTLREGALSIPDKETDPLRKSAIICVSIKIQTLWNSVLLCGEIHSKPHSNEDDGPVFSVAEVPLNGIDPLVRCCTLSFSERNVPFPGAQSCFTCTCKAARDAHVVLYEMHMSYRFTCTSKTTLHTEASYVTLRERALSIPEKEIGGDDKHH